MSTVLSMDYLSLGERYWPNGGPRVKRVSGEKGVRYPFLFRKDGVGFGHGSSAASGCGGNGLPRMEPGEFSFPAVHHPGALSRFSRPGGRKLGFRGDAHSGLLPDAESL